MKTAAAQTIGRQVTDLPKKRNLREFITGMDIFCIEVHESGAQDVERHNEIRTGCIEESTKEEEDQEQVCLVFLPVIPPVLMQQELRRPARLTEPGSESEDPVQAENIRVFR